jgi:hypothetical protein
MTRRSSKRKSSKRRSSKRPARVTPNYTAPKRGFVFEGGEEGEEGEDLRTKIRREMIGKLASEWNSLNSKLEARSFRSREERDEEGEYLYERAQEHAWMAMERWAKENEIDLDLDDLKMKTWPTEAKELYEKRLAEELRESGPEGDDTALRMSVVEDLIGELGGRMMRPYEHWNEEEQAMEYAERDRGDEGDDY